jgi:hypothetical protein
MRIIAGEEDDMLGIVGIPRGDTDIYQNDKLAICGRSKTLQKLEQRRADLSGDQAHQTSMDEQKKHSANQEVHERVYKRQRGNPAPGN